MPIVININNKKVNAIEPFLHPISPVKTIKILAREYKKDEKINPTKDQQKRLKAISENSLYFHICSS